MRRAGLGEAAAVWAAFLAFTVAIFTTYWRLPAHDLYRVSRSGLAGGASRALVYAAYPIALAAVAMLAVALDRLLAAHPGRRARRAALVLACVSVALCATVAWPGNVEQSDLDAKPFNAVTAAGVLLALGVTLWAGASTGIGGWAPWQRTDGARVAIGALLVVVALPWIFADLGIFIDDVPVLGVLFTSEELHADSKGRLTPAVHLGDHHGMNGVLLALSALLLSRELPRMRETALRPTLALYLSLLLAYGIGNAANDAWLEQVVKRGWTSWQIPDLQRPELSLEWGLLLAAGAAVYLAFWRPGRS
jgi:hypothetical protein